MLTHGFVLDEDGRKMSKSLGNVIAPQDVMKQSGADILRLWVVASDYAEDLRIGPEILKHMGDAYRRLRNTLRYLLGALAGFSPDEAVPRGGRCRSWSAGCCTASPSWTDSCGSAIADYDFHGMFTALHNFCAVDLSAFYFDIRKDRLYCDAADDPARRATRTVMDRTFDCLARWLAPDPVLHRRGGLARAARRRAGSQRPSRTVSRGAGRRGTTRRSGARWAELRDLRRVVTGALEVERAAKRIGSSLQAAVDISVPERLLPLLREVDLAELCITSAGTVRAGRAAGGRLHACRMCPVSASSSACADGARCERCWRVLPEVGHVPGMTICAGAAPMSLDRGAVPLAAVAG